eukprot:m51a1_g12894 hypothetical protein (208) ;mRNA; f:2037-2660
MQRSYVSSLDLLTDKFASAFASARPKRSRLGFLKGLAGKRRAKPMPQVGEVVGNALEIAEHEARFLEALEGIAAEQETTPKTALLGRVAAVWAEHWLACGDLYAADFATWAARQSRLEELRLGRGPRCIAKAIDKCNAELHLVHLVPGVTGLLGGIVQRPCRTALVIRRALPPARVLGIPAAGLLFDALRVVAAVLGVPADAAPGGD